MRLFNTEYQYTNIVTGQTFSGTMKTACDSPIITLRDVEGIAIDTLWDYWLESHMEDDMMAVYVRAVEIEPRATA